MDLRTVRAIAEGWPASAVFRTMPVTSPAVATDWTLTCPGESYWAIHSVQATLTTDANVANRHPDLTFNDGAVTYARIPLGTNITAGLTTIVTWVPLLGYAASAIVGNRLAVGIGDHVLAPGGTIGVTGTNLQAGDQWSAITVRVVEVFSGHVEHERRLADAIVDKADAIASIIEGMT